MTDTKSIYRFEEFVLNTARRELKNAGRNVEIEPRAFDVLVYLVENRDRAVDKGELQDAIWPGVYVTETALTRAVMKARKAVDDDASQQRVIKTLHGHGYRFIATLEREEPAASDEPINFPDTTPHEAAADFLPTRARFNFRVLALIGIAAVMVIVFAWISLRPSASLGDDIRIAVLPLQDNTANPELSWTSYGLMSYASKLMSSDESMLVVPVGSVISLAENIGWSGDLADGSNEDLLNKLRDIYGATHILAMELESEGNALRMNYALRIPSGELQMGTMVGDGGTSLAQGVVQAIYGNMFRRSHVGADTPLVSSDSFNNEAFARGMDLSVQGRCAEAVKFFRVIIEQEPSLVAPRYELAFCLRILGSTEEAEALLVSLVEEQRPMGPGHQFAEVLLNLGILYYRTGRLELSETAYSEALTVAESIGENVLKARVLQNMSILYKNRSELDEAARLLDLALLAYQDAGLEVLPGHLYSGRANLSMARGDFVEAEVDLNKALQAFRDIGDRRNEAMMLNNTGYLRRRQGRLEEAEAYHLRSLEIREEIGDRMGVGRIYGMLSGVYSAQGLYAQAISAAESAGEIARETNDRLFEATSLAQLAAAEASSGKEDEARKHYQQARVIFVEIQDRLRTLQTDLKIAGLDLRAGRLIEVEQLTRSVLTSSREHDIMSAEVEALELLGDLAEKRDDNDTAIMEYSNALGVVQETTWASKENTLKIKLANAYLNESNLEAAAPLMGALADGSRNVGSLKVQARFAFERGEVEKAVSLMSEAKELAAESWSESSEAILKTYQGQLP